MSGLSKRREMFVRQIRRQEKDLIKNELRAKLLSEECTVDERSKLGPSNEESSKIMANFEEQMMHLIMNKFKIQYIEKKNFNIGVAFTVFIEQIKAIEHPQGIQHLTQCYRTAKSLIQKHLDLTLSKQWPNDCDLGNYLQQLNRWSSVLNTILLQIKLKSRTFPQEIFEIDGFFNQWLNQTLEDLQAYEQADDLKLIMQGKDIKFTLKQIYSTFLESFENYKTQETIDLLQKIFSNEMIKLLVSSLSNHRLDDTCRLIIVYIFLEITKNGMKIIYQRIIDHDYLDYIRFTLAFQEGYKTKRKMSQSQQNQTKIVCKMCQFIVLGSQLDSSSLFWQKCVCSELKAVERQGITDTNVRCYIITTLFVCITNITDEKTLELMKEAEIFDWILKVIDELIDLNSSNSNITDLISEGVDVIHFFLQIGDCNMNGATVNPYKIKLQYSSGEAILSRCTKGNALLQKYGFETEQVLNSC